MDGNFHNAFNSLNLEKATLYSDDEIYVNGDLEVVGSLSDEKEVIVDAKGNISSLHWNNNTLEGYNLMDQFQMIRELSAFNLRIRKHQ